ncbi:MAG: hypothetical protein OEW12_03920 [Deltaproteobacteria bacterium]|nr:hypothetical protein [Deltaproteobacteria bacterium]
MTHPIETSQNTINRRFALVEKWGTRAGVILALVGFGLYIFSRTSQYVPIKLLASHWGKPLPQFITITGHPLGWDWLPLIGHSDIIALAGLVLLSSVIILAYGSVALLYLKKKDHLYFFLVTLQLAIFALAASNLLTVNH